MSLLRIVLLAVQVAVLLLTAEAKTFLRRGVARASLTVARSRDVNDDSEDVAPMVSDSGDAEQEDVNTQGSDMEADETEGVDEEDVRNDGADDGAQDVTDSGDIKTASQRVVSEDIEMLASSDRVAASQAKVETQTLVANTDGSDTGVQQHRNMTQADQNILEYLQTGERAHDDDEEDDQFEAADDAEQGEDDADEGEEYTAVQDQFDEDSVDLEDDAGAVAQGAKTTEGKASRSDEDHDSHRGKHGQGKQDGAQHEEHDSTSRGTEKTEQDGAESQANGDEQAMKDVMESGRSDEGKFFAEDGEEDFPVVPVHAEARQQQQEQSRETKDDETVRLMEKEEAAYEAEAAGEMEAHDAIMEEEGKDVAEVSDGEDISSFMGSKRDNQDSEDDGEVLPDVGSSKDSDGDDLPDIEDYDDEDDDKKVKDKHIGLDKFTLMDGTEAEAASIAKMAESRSDDDASVESKSDEDAETRQAADDSKEDDTEDSDDDLPSLDE